MSQISFADAEYAGKRKKTRREVFLEEMELVVPWKTLLKLIEPHYPVAGRGRRPYPLDSILRVHLMQNWFALSDPAMEMKVRFRGLAKNTAHIVTLFALSNLWMARKRLMAAMGVVRPKAA
jgi:hypothetical protein